MLRTLTKVRSLLTPSQRRSAVLLMGLMVVGMALETLSVGLVIPVIALMTQAGGHTRIASVLPAVADLSPVQLVQAAMIALVVIYLAKNLFLALLAWRQTKFAYGLQAELSQRLFTIYLRQPYLFHLQRNSAQLIRYVTAEITMFAESIMSTLTLFTELLVLAGIAGLLVFVEPLGAFIVVLVLGGASWLFYRATRSRIARWGRARAYHESQRMQHLQQGLGGAKDVKLLGREHEFLEQYREHNYSSARVNQYQATVQLLPRLWLEFLAVIGLATLVLTMLARGSEVVAIVPTLALFAAAAFRLMPSANRVMAAVQMLRYGYPVVNAVHDELKLDSPDPAIERASKHAFTGAGTFEKEISLANIEYSYPDAPAPALSGLNFNIARGESVGFVGSSGSGKSTLIDVILGLLSPRGGRITVDGRDIRENLRGWQDQIGYVPQTIYLTDDTICRNVAFGLPASQIDLAAVERAIKAAQLDQFVGDQPRGLETIVGERGVRLSGGQRQRIGIARALYHDPGVLVLDEATSALDTETERGVMDAVAALHGRKTVLIVAHRLSTVAQCDRIFRLDQGRIVEHGAPGEVLPLTRAG